MKKKSIFLTIIFFYFLSCFDCVLAAVDSVNIQMSVDNCNNNGICEPLIGETYSGCPLDLCEPPPVVATTTSTSSNATRVSGNIIPIQNNLLNNLQSFFLNFLNFKIFVRIKDVTDKQFSIEWNRENSNSYFRLVKSRIGYPKDAYDGVVVFEGKGTYAGPEYFDGLYYYGLFELGLSGFIPRNYFTNPDKSYSKKIFDLDKMSISSDNFPKKSYNIYQDRIEITQDDRLKPIVNNKVDLDSRGNFLVKIFDNKSDQSRYLVSFNKILSNDVYLYNLKKGSGFIYASIESSGLYGFYILKISHLVFPNKYPEIREILINFPEKNKNNFNFCGKYASISYIVCLESVGPFFHLKKLWEF